MTAILDTNRNTFGHYDALHAAGVKTIIRYVAAGLEREEKVIKPGEAKAIAAAGFRLGLVYEIGGKPSGTVTGQRDGAYARNYAPTVGAPDGAILWYAIDFDAGPSEWPGVKAAFTAFKAALGGKFRVGAYASGWICQQLRAAGLIDARWLTDSMGFRGSRAAAAAGDYELKQALPAKIAGLDTDPDAAHIGVDGMPVDIGDFVPFAAPPAAAAEPAGVA